MVTPRVEFRQRPFDIPANVEAARVMINDGLTDSQVADRFGVSRATVAKMRGRNSIRTNYRSPADVRRRAIKKHGLIARNEAAVVDEKPKPQTDSRPVRPEAWWPLPGVAPVSLVDLDPGMCKWPIGEGRPFLFCGADAGPHVYCPTHRRLSVGRGTEAERAAHRAREKVPV